MATIDDIRDAHRGIRPQVPVSPLEHSVALSEALGCTVLLKCEHLQPTGSFKVRGAANRLRLLDEAARRAGVFTASTGNHGLGVARAGALAGVPVTVFVAASALRSKLDAILALGAGLEIVDGNPIDAEHAARQAAAIGGKTYVSPYNDPAVVAGQGTIGLELLEQVPGLDAVFVAVGGGGLVGGIGSALKALRPETRVIGVWPENSACMLGAMQAGRVVHVAERETLSDATAGMVEDGAVTLPICQAVIDQTVTVSEAEIADGMRQVAAAEHWMVEGAAGVAMAGLLQRRAAFRGRTVAVVLCGRNIPLPMFMAAVGGA